MDGSVGRASNWKARRSSDAGSSPWCRKDSVSPLSADSADSLMVPLQPPCAIACINISAHVNNPEHCQPYHCLDIRKYWTY